MTRRHRQPSAPRPFAVLDIDGVLADVRHRLHHLATTPKNWSGFFAAVADDPALEQGLAVGRDLAVDHELVFLTGRPERLRPQTTAWLLRHGLPAGRLLMRRHRDYRPARVAKLDQLTRLLEERPVAVVVDDDPDVVDALRTAGLTVLHADWVDRSEPLHQAQEQDGRT